MDNAAGSSNWPVEYATLFTGFGVAGVAGVATFSGVQTWHAPMPTLVVIPAFFFGPPAPILGLFAFYVWNYQLFMAKPEIPIRSFVLFTFFASVSAFSIGYELFPLRRVGYYSFLIAVNFAFVVALWFIYQHGRRSPSVKNSWRFHALLFVYLFTYCMPYTGELP